MAFAQVNSNYYTKAGYDSSKHEAIQSICLHMISLHKWFTYAPSLRS